MENKSANSVTSLYFLILLLFGLLLGFPVEICYVLLLNLHSNFTCDESTRFVVSMACCWENNAAHFPGQSVPIKKFYFVPQLALNHPHAQGPDYLLFLGNEIEKKKRKWKGNEKNIIYIDL